LSRFCMKTSFFIYTSVMTAGYSKRSLIDKLGIKPYTTIYIINQPKHYKQLLQPLPQGTSVKTTIIGLSVFTQFFTASKDELKDTFSSLTSSLSASEMFWINWSGLKFVFPLAARAKLPH